MAGKTMKGLWWMTENSNMFFRKDILEPSIKEPNDVKVKVAFSGICGSDIHYMGGTMGEMKLKEGGMIMGHEFSGTVVDVGSKCKFKIGDRVCINPNNCCGNCQWNKDGLPHFCPKNAAVGVQKNGGWAQYCVVDDTSVYMLPKNVDLLQGALGEPYSCVLRGWNRLSPLPPTTSRVLIQGAGIIGSLFCILLHHSGYANVTISELHDGRRKLCKDMDLGYNVISPQELDAMFVEKSTDGFHLVIDCTGNTIAVKKALDIARRGGKVLIFGCCASGKTIPLEPYQVFWKELTILGTFINPLCFDDTMDLLEKLEAKGYLDYEKLGVKLFPIDQFHDALDAIKSGQASKAMFKLD